MNRRDFLRNCALGLTAAALGPALTWEPALAAGDTVLVALHLVGGNDGLNTLIPVRDPLYQKLRPTLALTGKDVPRLTPEWGLHPALRQLRDLPVTWVPGVGRPDHDRSHFRSSDLWQTAGTGRREGWLGALARRHELASVSVGDGLSRALFGGEARALAFHGEEIPELPGDPAVQGALRRLYAGQADHGPVGEALAHSCRQLLSVVGEYRARCARIQLAERFPDNRTGQRLELVARLLAAGLPPRLFHVAVGDFDTHENQLQRQRDALTELDEALGAFWREVQRLGMGRRVLVLGYTEFGRRVQENASGGTDHGAGGLAFLLGGRATSRIHGELPDLARLRDGDLAHQVDYRSLYATVLERHFRAGAARELWPDCSPVAGLLEGETDRA